MEGGLAHHGRGSKNGADPPAKTQLMEAVSDPERGIKKLRAV